MRRSGGQALAPAPLSRIVLALAALAAGCADYQFTVNDRVVYSPTPLFADYDIADSGLNECVQQHIRDGQITAAGQLTALNCSHAGIANLTGLETFSKLQRLKLSNNRIADTAPLAALGDLREVHLDGNALRGVAPLGRPGGLTRLDLRGNPALNCVELERFKDRPTLTVAAPEHCSA